MLLLVGVIAALVSIVPLFTWAMTGSARQAWQSARGYILVLVILLAIPALVGLVAAIAGLPFMS